MLRGCDTERPKRDDVVARRERDAYRVHDLCRETAIALREAYGCEGVSTRQHNESAGDQTVWH